MTARLICFAKNESGATAVEYAVLAGIALAIALVVSQIGATINGFFESVSIPSN